MDNTIQDNWFVTAFGKLYPVLYAHRTVEAARPEAAFAMRAVGLRSQESVLDLCCGNGRHLAHLQKVAPAACGLDYSADLLALAKRQCRPGTPLVRADMRSVPFGEAFDVIFNFFTSFGYFHRPEENAAVAWHMGRALKPGGRFFMDYLNGTQVRATLVPESIREEAGYRIHEVRWIDEQAQRVNKKTLVYYEEALVLETGESVRLYSLDELEALLHFGGLRIDMVYGNYGGEAWTETQPRMIIVGHRSP